MQHVTHVNRRVGRPLDRARDAEIMKTTFALLNEVGFENLRMEDVAVRARVGLSTIYRRWRTREELIIAAMKLGFHEDAIGDHATPREHLREMAGKLSNENAQLLPGIVIATQHDEQLASAFRDGWLWPRMRALGDAIQRSHPSLARERAEHVAELALASLTFRFLLTRQAIDDAYIDELLDEVIEPLCRA